MTQVEYSVVVPAHQAENVIGRCVRALNEQSIDRNQYEVIIVDDGSTDATVARARAAGADTVLTVEHNGPAAARNIGIDHAAGDIVLFTDADCEVSFTWIERITAPFQNPETMGAKGTYRTCQRSVVARLVQLEYEFRYERMAKLDSIDFIDTYAAAYRRELLMESGGFDPTYPIPSAEDVDLSFRLAGAGHRFVFVPEAQVWHQHPTSLITYLTRKGRYGIWRALLYLRFTDKIGGDAHTDPMLKLQFVLAAVSGLCATVGLLRRSARMVRAAGIGIGVLILTTLSFCRWAWQHDKAVAIVWPMVTLVRVFVQGIGLAVGLVYHSLFTNHDAATARDE